MSTQDLQPQQEPSSLPSSAAAAAIHNQFSHLQLSTASFGITNFCPSSAAINDDPSQVIITDCCTTCGNPMKRRSPSSYTSSAPACSDPFDISPQPKPRHLFASSTKNSLSGYRVIPFPTVLPNSSVPTLGRTDSRRASNLTDTNSPEVLNCTGSPSPARDSGGSRPPLPPLARSRSDPSPFLDTTPPTAVQNVTRPRKGSRSPNSGESGSGKTGDESPAKRLKRKCERMREMKQWFDEMVRESEQDDTSEASLDTGYYSANETNIEEKNTNGGSEIDMDERTEEEQEVTVSTERDGDAINIHYKCRCGTGCAIRLVGQNIYYKLV